MSRRADRLFQIVQILRGRRVTTAALLAERLEVSERTIYRDIRDLSLSGVPIEGEVGSGYRLMAGFDLPPLMLTQHESEALMVAIRLLKTWGGDSLSQALESAQEKCWRYCRQRVGAELSKRGFSRQILVISRIHAVRSISYIARFQLSRCWRCIIAMSPGTSRGATFSRWDYFSGASTGCWLAGARSVMIIVVFALIDV